MANKTITLPPLSLEEAHTIRYALNELQFKRMEQSIDATSGNNPQRGEDLRVEATKISKLMDKVSALILKS